MAGLTKITLEKHWQRYLTDYLFPSDGVHIVTLPDDNKKAQAAGTGSAREASSKPYDFGLLIAGTYIGVECKQTKTSTIYSHDIRECQHDGLADVKQAGGHPFLALYYKFKEKGIVHEAGFMVEYVSATDDYHYEDLLKRSATGGDVMCATYGGYLAVRNDSATVFNTVYPMARTRFRDPGLVLGFMRDFLHLDDEEIAKLLAQYTEEHLW